MINIFISYALFVASEKGNSEIVKNLLAQPEIDINQRIVFNHIDFTEFLN